jgi:hypothetical protein
MPLPVATVSRIATYSEWLRVEAHDPYRHDYTGIYAQFAINEANQDHEALMNRFMSNSRAPQFVLAVAWERGQPRIHLLSRPARYQPMFGAGTTRWDNQIFATKGDIIDQQIITVQLLPDAMEALRPVTVPTLGHLLDTHAQDPAVEMFGPYIQGDPDTEEVTVRRMVFIPNSYAAMLLSSKGYTP